MSGKATRNRKEKVQIDADWLLGESSDKSRSEGSWFWRGVITLLCIIAVVWSWPYVSTQWLQSEWQSLLARSTNKSSDDVLPILLALSEVNPSNSESVVMQLASADPEKRLVAFHLLQQRIETWNSSNPPSHTELRGMCNSLHSMVPQVPEADILRGQLAARLLRLVNPEIPNSSELRSVLDKMVASSGQQEQPELMASSDSSLSKLVSETVGSPAVKAEVVENAKKPSVTASVTRISDSDSAPRSAGPNPPEIRRLQNEVRVVASQVGSETNPVDTDLSAPPKLPLRTESQRVGASGLNSGVVKSPPPPPMRIAETATTDQIVSKPAPIETPANDPPAVAQREVPIRGFDKLPDEELLPLLSSTQSRMVQQAADELTRRGLSPSHLEMALTLAQGDSSKRIAEMERIARDPNINPIPWLTWMAERADRDVRQKAVVLLGSMSHEDAQRSLRMLKMRESDSSIADKISQALLASGPPVNSLR